MKPVKCEKCGNWTVGQIMDVTARNLKLTQALNAAIRTVECASLDPKTGEELPWYRMARAALLHLPENTPEDEKKRRERLFDNIMKP